MTENVLIVHGGGPTAVMNASLYGVITAARELCSHSKIYAARNGTGGLIRDDLIDLTHVSEEDLEKLKSSPGTAIGTSRDPLERRDYERMLEVIEKHHIGYVFFNGGNGTMDACGHLYDLCQEKGSLVRVMGVPKTMDNDLAITDHSPGFASAARYIAQSVKEVCYDVRSLPIHVVVIETSGRNAGWITAASSLSDPEGIYCPDLIYLPEVAFDEQQFLVDVAEKLKTKSGLVVVASEGLKDKEGNPIVKPIFKTDRATYFGDVSSHLANLIVKELGYKARGEKPGLLGRASIALQSPIDREEAILAGRVAVEAALSGQTGKMVAFERETGEAYAITPVLVDIKEVMLHEKTLPAHYINETQNGVTQAFIDWCQPLIGADLPEMISFN
ncbi:diphosphate--fructose-6-phosphate 1-phosphotransferase [Streptococcus plurextorum]|uniref:diphosphate--fructose-6-phosphate 1-phosphotransferase n=1 Tax=Streptococcus plurextorum TaxID=456876 RepID=UPI000406589E|nr:diphosphate--fructose-6-phosphate 1-phosphotransferase [Streptococcus plurextorum]